MKKYHIKKKQSLRNQGLIKSLGREAQIQIALIKYINLTYPKLLIPVHVPNDMTRSSAEGYIKKLMGMLPGFPDLIIFHKSGKVLLLELKAQKGRISTSQIQTQNRLKLFNQTTKTAWNLNDAIQIIDNFAKITQ